MAPPKMWWFRVDCDDHNDPRIKRLLIEERYLYQVVMHSFARRSPTPGVLLIDGAGPVTAEDLAGALGYAMQVAGVEAGIRRMIDQGLVDEVLVDAGNDVATAWRIVNWDRRNPKSDRSGAARVQAHRDRKKKQADGGQDTPAADDVDPVDEVQQVELLTAAARVVGTRDAERAAAKPGKAIEDYDAYRSKCISARYSDVDLAVLVCDHPGLTADAIADLYDAQRSRPPLTLVPDPPASTPPAAPIYTAQGPDPDAIDHTASAAHARAARTRPRT